MEHNDLLVKKGKNEVPVISGDIMVLAGYTGPAINIYDMSNWSRLPDPTEPPTTNVSSMDISPDGTLCAMYWYSGGPILKIYDTTTWLVVENVDLSRGAFTISGISDMKFSPDGTQLGCSCGNTDASLASYAVFNVSDWSQEPATVIPPNNTSRGCAWSHDGAWFVVAGRGGSHLVLNTSDWSEEYSGSFSGLDLSPPTFTLDDSILLFGVESGIHARRLDTSDWSQMPDLVDDATGETWYCRINHAGTIAAIVHNNAPYVTMWDTSDWSKLPDFPVAMLPTPRNIRWNSDDSICAIGLVNSGFYQVYDTNGNSLDLSTWTLLPALATPPNNHIFEIAFTN